MSVKASLALSAGIVLAGVLLGPVRGIGMPESIRIPKVEEHGKGDPPDSALFSHWAHNQFECYDCHPGIFPQGRAGFTHDDMDEGRFCGACHNDEIAWSPDDADVECEFCHRE